MADVKPLRALHYDPAVVGALDAVVAPPYDVIDPEQRAQLADRSPYNVVRIDLPEADEPGGDPYAAAAGLLERWQGERAGGRGGGAGGRGAGWCVTTSRRSGRSCRTSPARTAPRTRAAVCSRACASRSTAPAG